VIEILYNIIIFLGTVTKWLYLLVLIARVWQATIKCLIKRIARIYVPVQRITRPLVVMMLVFITFLKRKELATILRCVRATVDVEPDIGLVVVLLLVRMIRVMNLENEVRVMRTVEN
jgi:hypothetical protein